MAACNFSRYAPVTEVGRNLPVNVSILVYNIHSVDDVK